MPELPELQAHAERLTEALAGRVLTGFRPLSFTALKTAVPAPDGAVGRPLDGVRRRGKHLLLPFSDPEDPHEVGSRLTFVVHLMQGGRLLVDHKQAAKPRGGQARWTFDEAPALLLTEAGTERRAGVWVALGDAEAQEPLDHLGPEADAVGLVDLAQRLATTSVRLHGFLRDQRQVAGIGRRLANEICHRARLSPFATTSKLDDEQIQRLHGAMAEVITESLAEERARPAMSSAKERTSTVHQHVGEACPVCGDTVRAVEYATYTVAYCPSCQTGGRVLADNTTSRFLR